MPNHPDSVDSSSIEHMNALAVLAHHTHSDVEFNDGRIDDTLPEHGVNTPDEMTEEATDDAH